MSCCLPTTEKLSVHFSPLLTDQHLNVIICKDKTKNNLIHYFHACCFSPSIATFIKAVQNGNLVTWPGLTHKLIKKYLEPSIATAKGHLDQERKNLQSTQPPSNEHELDFSLLQIFQRQKQTKYVLLSSLFMQNKLVMKT